MEQWKKATLMKKTHTFRKKRMKARERKKKLFAWHSLTHTERERENEESKEEQRKTKYTPDAHTHIHSDFQVYVRLCKLNGDPANQLTQSSLNNVSAVRLFCCCCCCLLCLLLCLPYLQFGVWFYCFWYLLLFYYYFYHELDRAQNAFKRHWRTHSVHLDKRNKTNQQHIVVCAVLWLPKTSACTHIYIYIWCVRVWYGSHAIYFGCVAATKLLQHS